MKVYLLPTVLISLIISGLLYYLYIDNCNVIGFYQKDLRGNLFAGFLTIGGFLMALKTFIVIKLKENIYDDHRYIERFEMMKKLKPNLKRYQPLQNLSDLLFWSVLSSLVAAFSQLSIGLFNNIHMVFIAITMAIIAAAILLLTMLIIKDSLNEYFYFLNQN